MFINNLQLALTEKELNILINKYLPSDLPVADLVATLEKGEIKLSGFARKVVTVPFCAWIKISSKGSSKIGLKITKIDAVGPVGNVLRGLIWNIVLRLLPTKLGVRSYGNRLRINLDELLSYWNIPTLVNFESITIEDRLLKIQLSGNVEPPESLEKYLKPASGDSELNA